MLMQYFNILIVIISEITGFKRANRQADREQVYSSHTEGRQTGRRTVDADLEHIKSVRFAMLSSACNIHFQLAESLTFVLIESVYDIRKFSPERYPY